MNNVKKYIILGCLLALTTACEKKEILPGKREEFLKIADQGVIVNKELAGIKIQATAASSISSCVDVAGNKQHDSINYKMSENPKQLWNKSFGRGPVTSLPICFGGNIYVVDALGVLCCISQKDGKTIWEKEIAKQSDEASFSGGITANNGTIYATSNTGKVIAINSKTKKQLWSKDLKFPLKGAPLFVDGKIIVTTVENQTFALSASDGNILWTKTTNKEQTMMADAGIPAVFGGDVICTYSSGDVMSINVATSADNWGDVLFSSNTSESGSVISHIAASPVVHNGFVLVATSESKIALIDATTGVRAWEQNVGTVTSPVIIEGWAFVLSSEKELVCLSMTDGSIKWSNKLQDAFPDKSRKDTKWTGPSLINGNIVVFNTNGDMLSFDTSTGSIKKKTNIDCSVSRVPIIINETMYITTERAEIYAIK